MSALRVNDVVDLLLDIEEHLSKDTPMTLMTQLSHLGVSHAIAEFLDSRSESFKDVYDKRLEIRLKK